MERTLALVFVCLVLALSSSAAAQDKRRPMKIDDLFRFKRVSDPQVSPDGQNIAYVVGTVNLAENKTKSSIWLAPVGKGEPRQLTADGHKDRHPRWSPDGKHLLFESNRAGGNQLFVLSLDGGEAKQLTTISSEAGDAIWSRDGSTIAFVSAVYPEFSDKPFKESDALNKKKAEETEKGPVKAKVFSKLFYRHWDSYVEDKRQHLFVMSFKNGKAGEPKDVTPGDRDASPTSTTFSISDDYTFSPSGKYLLYTAPPEADEAWSTNYDIWRVSVKGGTPECLTKDNKAADGTPRFSPDGKRLAYRAQRRAGYEADQWRLLVVECDADGAFTSVPRPAFKADLSVDDFAWAATWNKGSADVGFVFVADRDGYRLVLTVNGAGEVRHEPVALLGMSGSLSADAAGKQIAFTVSRMSSPSEVYTVSMPAPNKDVLAQVTQVNRRLLGSLDMPRPESVTVKGAGGTPMQMWILKPPGFDPQLKWPLVYLVHGGPQGAWEDGWSFRWCPELWAAQGYVVALPNPRGSTGFGQKYVDEISGDWGGKCYEDLMKGVEYMEAQPYIDKDRIAAAGASFGGYMMNWFAVNTNKFKTLITHCSVWNFESMYATTDELWFDEWEHGGPPWGKNRASYEKHSPHRLAGNLAKFKTPMLVIQNDLDFRCPIGQGHELFTTLQRLKVPSRMINFPDEGHWVLKPKNSEYWHKEVFAWLTKYVTPGGQ